MIVMLNISHISYKYVKESIQMRFIKKIEQQYDILDDMYSEIRCKMYLQR